ncbi:MAG: hypothetical protein ACFB0G_11540 [Leptolyngbyaceae cyanobacterium]
MAGSLKEFRDRHPTASICSDVLQVHNEQFVVQVTVEAPELGRATGLSSHADIEVAEDRARARALQALGWGHGNSAGTAEPTVPLPEVAPLLPTTVAPEDVEVIAVSDESVAPRLSQPAASGPDLPAAPAISVAEVPKSKPSPLVTKPRSPVPSSKNGSGSTSTVKSPVASPSAAAAAVIAPESETPLAPQPDNEPAVAAAVLTDIPTEPIDPAALPAPINLSDVIAQTDMELRRLGWSVETGRDYLEKTYNKRSRHELSEEELIQFLCHLESLSESQS